MTQLGQTGVNEVPGGGILNPRELHMACVLLLDTSSSMGGDPINSLNKAISDFKELTSLDELKRLDVAIIEFNDSARVVQDFTPFPQLKPVAFSASGDSAMGEGINLAIDKVKERNEKYLRMGTPYVKPWIFMISIGKPTDDISAARRRISDEESKGSHGKLRFWAIGVPGYNQVTLTSLTRRCIALNEVKFDGIFNWFSPGMIRIGPSTIVFDRPELPKLPSGAQVIPWDW